MADTAALAAASNLITPITIIFASTTFISIIHRFYVRARISRTVSGVDWIMLLTCMLFGSLCGLSLTAARVQLLSISSANDYSQQLSTLLKIGTVLYALSATFVKLSVGGWMPKTVMWTKPITNGNMLLMVIFTCIAIGMTLFPCGARLLNNLNQTCNATSISKGVEIAWSSLNATVSMWLLINGIYEIYADMCSTFLTKSICTSITLLLGATTVSAAGARVVLLLAAERFANQTELKLLLSLASVIEVGAAILLGCLLVTRPQFAYWLGDGSLSDPRLMAQHGYPAKDIYDESRPTTAVKTAPSPPPKKDEVFEWKEAVERRKKRQGVYVSAKEMEEGMSPVVRQDERSLWRS